MAFHSIFLVYPCSAIYNAINHDNVVYINSHMFKNGNYIGINDFVEENFKIMVPEMTRQGNAVICELSENTIYWLNAIRDRWLFYYPISGNRSIKSPIPVTIIYPDPKYKDYWMLDIKDLYNQGIINESEYKCYVYDFDYTIQNTLHFKDSHLFPGVIASGDPKKLDLYSQFIYPH